MERVELSISDLSLAQKLDLMEALWADLSRDDKNLPSPAWHRSVLEDRQKAFEAGKIAASDWEQVKKKIGEHVSRSGRFLEPKR